MSYDQGFVTFFDILGFKRLIDTKSKEEMIKIMDTFYSTSKRITLLNDENKENDNNKNDIICFSDSIVKVCKIKDESDRGEFCKALLGQIVDISTIQLELMNAGVIVRGGMVFDEIYCDSEKGVIFGPALVQAYKLESNVAIYPRIIVSPDIIDELDEYLNNGDSDYKKDIYSIMKCLTLDKDGMFFVDYLKQSMSSQYYLNERYPYKDDIHVFDNDMYFHKDLIIKGVKDDIGLTVQQKYNWLTSYHNDINIRSEEDVLSSKQAEDTFITDDENPYYRSFMDTCYLFDKED